MQGDQLLFKPQSLLVKTLTPLLLFVICFVLRIIYVSAQDICIDEPFSVFHAQSSVKDIIRFLKPTNNPPLFEILLHYWIKLFGISVFSVRFLPVLFGALAVIFIYKTGQKFFSYEVGLCVGLIYCFSSHAIYYSHDCRVYTLFLLLSVASVYFFMNIVSGNSSSRKNLILWGVINVLLIYSHYFGFFVLFVELLAVLFFFRKHLKNVLITFFVTAMFYLPQIFILVSRLLFSTESGTWMKEPVGLESIYNMFWLFSNMPVVAVFCLALMVWIIANYFSNKNKNYFDKKLRGFIYVCFFIPFMVMFFVSYKIPVYNGRYLFFLLPFYYLSISIMAYSVFNKQKHKIILLSVLIILFGMTVQLNPDKKRESKAVTEFIKANKKPGDLVIICTHEFLTNFAYYYNIDFFKSVSENEYETLENKLHQENIYPVRSITEVNGELIEKAKRIIYLDAGADFSNPGNNVLSTLEQKFNLKNKKQFEEIFKVYTFTP